MDAVAVNASTAPPWYATSNFRRAVIGVLVVIALVEGYMTLFHRRNDFECHVVFGNDFLAGEPYRHPGNFYPLGRVLFDALPASLESPLSRGTFYAAALLGLVGIFWMWRRLPYKEAPPSTTDWAIVALTLAMSGAHLLRDLDEAGLQILALFLLSAGAYALAHGRPGVCGACLAAAAVYKATPLLFLPFLLWKREWRAAGWMAAFLIAFSLAPALYLGWDGMVAGNQAWLQRTLANTSSLPDAYPSIPGIELPMIYNVSLPALLARYVETYPEGHSLYMNHPWFLQFGNLPVEQAKIVVRGLILALGVWIAWSFRRSWQTPKDRHRLPREWAIACLFAALLSPLCWKQHLVFGLPCAFLVARDLFALPGLRHSSVIYRRIVEIGLIAAAVWLTRSSLIGEANALLCLSYKLDTILYLYLGWSCTRTPCSRPAPATTAAFSGLATA